MYSEIERKKEELIPKRGDFFHLKVFRKAAEDVITREGVQTTLSKYKEPMADLSTTFKFAPGVTSSGGGMK